MVEGQGARGLIVKFEHDTRNKKVAIQFWDNNFSKNFPMDTFDVTADQFEALAAVLGQ